MSVPVVLHIDIDAFFAAVEVMLDPSLEGKPVIVGGMPDERGVVCTASYEARTFGVHSGMALRTAGKKCPRGIFLRGRYHVYSRISKRFFDCLRQFSPRVDETSVDEAYMDLSGMSYLYPSVYDMAEKIKQTVERTIGLQVTAGLGFSKLGAKLATEAGKPGGLFFVRHERDFLSQLSLEKVPGIGPHTVLILHGMGIKRVWELERKYPAIWKRVIAPHFYSSGKYPKKREPASRSFSRETTFPMDLTNRDLLMAHLSYLLDRLSVHLVKHGLFARRLEVKVRFSDFSTFTRRATLDFPTFSYAEMMRVGQGLLSALLRKRKLPLRLVGVKVEDITEERDLLPFISIRGEKLGTGIQKIKEKFGNSAISTARAMMLEELYPREKEGVVLKTASLTK